MNKILRKIPLIVWVIILTIFSFFIVKQNLITNLSNEQIRLFSSLMTFIGLIFVAINIQKQWKNERIKTEYLNQPDFHLKGFSTDDIDNSTPCLCPNPTECTDDHWLDIVQKGNLAARNLKVGLFTLEEAHKNVDIKERWLDTERLAKNDVFQYKLPLFTIPFKYFTKSTRNCFVLLMEYDSEYSNIKYKRGYHLCATSVDNPTNTTENDWKSKIYFYDSTLEDAIDTESTTVKEILLNKWLSLARWSRIKKDYSCNDWLIDL